MASPWIIKIRLASNLHFRQGIFRIKKHIPPSNLTSLEDTTGGFRWEVMTVGASFLLMAAHAGGTRGHGIVRADTSQSRAPIEARAALGAKRRVGGPRVSIFS